MKRLLRIGLWMVMAFIVIYGIVLIIEWSNIRKAEVYSQNFKAIPELGTFQETTPRIYLGQKRLPHAVLILHGWSASTHEFVGLTEALKKQAIPYYAPQLTGFGLIDISLLNNIKASDWLRDAINGYDVLAAVANEVSVVGHSNGGVLAIFVAQHRPVKHLILSSPYLAPSKEDEIRKRALNTPVISQMIKFCLPVFNKPETISDKNRGAIVEPVFRYPTLPIKSLVALWMLQDSANIAKANFQDLNILYGTEDDALDMPAILAKLNQQKIRYQATEYKYSAHNLLQDREKQQVMEKIINILQH